MRERPASKVARVPAGPPDPRSERFDVQLTNVGATFFDRTSEPRQPVARLSRTLMRVWYLPTCPRELEKPIADFARTWFRYGTKYVAVDGGTFTWGFALPTD